MHEANKDHDIRGIITQISAYRKEGRNHDIQTLIGSLDKERKKSVLEVVKNDLGKLKRLLVTPIKTAAGAERRLEWLDGLHESFSGLIESDMDAFYEDGLEIFRTEMGLITKAKMDHGYTDTIYLPYISSWNLLNILKKDTRKMKTEQFIELTSLALGAIQHTHEKRVDHMANSTADLLGTLTDNKNLLKRYHKSNAPEKVMVIQQAQTMHEQFSSIQTYQPPIRNDYDRITEYLGKLTK